MTLLIVLVLAAFLIWMAFKTYTFFAKIGAETFDKNLSDSWTVVPIQVKQRKSEVKPSHSEQIFRGTDVPEFTAFQ